MLLTLVYQFIFQLTSFLDLKSFSVRNNRQNKFSKLYRKLRWLLPYNTTVVELLAFICPYKYLLFLQRCMLFCTQRAEPSFIRSPNVWTSKSCSLSSNWFFESEPPFIDKTDGFNWARYTKRTAIRPGFETVSQQHAAHAQQRSYSGHAESFSSTPKSSKQKKGSLVFGEFALLPLPLANIITSFSLRANWWARGGVGGQFPRNLNWSQILPMEVYWNCCKCSYIWRWTRIPNSVSTDSRFFPSRESWMKESCE